MSHVYIIVECEYYVYVYIYLNFGCGHLLMFSYHSFQL